MLLMLKVATLTKVPLCPVPLGRLSKAATEFVVPAAIILPVEGNGKPRTKSERLVGKSYKDGAPEVSQFIINPRWNGRILGALYETILLQAFQRGPIQAAGEVRMR
jgi:hypothetical protein